VLREIMSDETPLPFGFENSPASSGASNERDVRCARQLARACAEAARARPERALTVVLGHLRESAGAERAFLLEAAPPPQRVRVIATSLATSAPGTSFSKSVAARALRGERALFWADLRRESLWTDGASVRALELRSALAAPVPAGDGRRAAIVLDSRAAMPVDGRGGETLLRTFAGVIGLLRCAVPVTVACGAGEAPTLVGRAPEFLRLLRDVRSAARVPLPALILGESGTGKELIARRLHEGGPRASRPFVAINCAAIPETLLERELFGAARGAFTGADRDHAGLFRQADGGTVFLDEIGDMPLTLQAKLLRVLQERSVRAVGALEESPVDVRIVSATHRDLGRLVAAGRFRPDLRYRLEVLVMRVPPLRERAEDLPLLAARLLERLAERCLLPLARLDAAARTRLAAHSWPGNVRELESVLARALLRARDGLIRAHDLDFGPASSDGDRATSDDLEGLERGMIEAALRDARGNVTAAAQQIGWSRQTLYRKMDALGVRGRAVRVADGCDDQDDSEAGGTKSSDSSTFQ
jgi:transcriptional regulator with AAA-type ATPase domain